MAKKSKEDKPVNVNDDNSMREAGFMRPYPVTPRDPEVWTKSNREKKALKKLRRVHKEDMHFNNCPHKPIRVESKLIIFLKKNKIYDKSTYSIKCWQSDVPEIVRSFDKNVIKYSFNGKTYAPNEVPFWR